MTMVILLTKPRGRVCDGVYLFKNFPTTAGALDTSYNGSCDAFVSRLNDGSL